MREYPEVLTYAADCWPPREAETWVQQHRHNGYPKVAGEIPGIIVVDVFGTQWMHSSDGRLWKRLEVRDDNDPCAQTT